MFPLALYVLNTRLRIDARALALYVQSTYSLLMTTRDELVAAVTVTYAAYSAAFAAANGDAFAPACNETHRAYGLAMGALRAHDEAAVAAAEAARKASAPARRTVRRSDGRVVRTVGRKGWTEY